MYERCARIVLIVNLKRVQLFRTVESAVMNTFILDILQTVHFLSVFHLHFRKPTFLPAALTSDAMEAFCVFVPLLVAINFWTK